ncbi:MAG: aliphatic sulfonate ABC transporter substrate-binding protein [Bacilli bacterium]
MSKKWKYSFLTLALFTLLTGCSEDKKKEETAPVKKPNEGVEVHIGFQGKTGVLPYAQSKGLFEKAFEKEGVKVVWTEFASGPPHFEALASGRLDFGEVGGTPVIGGQAAGIEFKALAVTNDGKKGNSIVLPKGSPIKELKDLKGKKIGVAKGSSAYNFLYMALDRAGLTDKDVEIIQLQPDEARAAFDGGSIDAWSIWEPFTTSAVFQSDARILVSGEDLDIFTPGFLIARTKFTEEHSDLTVLFLKTYEEVRSTFVANSDQVAEELSKSQNIDVEIIKEVYRKVTPILSPVTEEFQKAHQAQADFLYSVGGIDKKLDTKLVFDNSFVEQVVK